MTKDTEEEEEKLQSEEGFFLLNLGCNCINLSLVLLISSIILQIKR